MLDATVSLGNLLQIIAMLGGGLYFLYSMKGELAVINNVQQNFKDQLNVMNEELKVLSKITIEIARQDERMNAQDIRLTTLSVRIDEVAGRYPEPPRNSRKRG